jgi:hypothetical protein
VGVGERESLEVICGVEERESLEVICGVEERESHKVICGVRERGFGGEEGGIIGRRLRGTCGVGRAARC